MVRAACGDCCWPRPRHRCYLWGTELSTPEMGKGGGGEELQGTVETINMDLYLADFDLSSSLAS